jgi:hypothetical protein
MRLRVNLRGDLAKLSDAELVERLETNWLAYDAAETKPAQTGLAWTSLWHSRRGPLRHPRVYRFLSVLGQSDGPAWLVFFISTLLSAKNMEPLLRSDSDLDKHLTLCEIRDIMDEMKRRVAARKGIS